MRFELRRLHELHGTTTVYVTHDQVEAMTLADRMAVMDSGRLQQVDTPLEVYRNPANAFVAGFIGSPPMNLLQGVAVNGRFSVGDTEFTLPAHLRGCSGEGHLGIRPEDIEVAVEGGIRVTLEGEEHLGGERILHFNLSGQGCECGLTWRIRWLGGWSGHLYIDSVQRGAIFWRRSVVITSDNHDSNLNGWRGASIYQIYPRSFMDANETVRVT